LECADVVESIILPVVTLFLSFTQEALGLKESSNLSHVLDKLRAFMEVSAAKQEHLRCQCAGLEALRKRLCDQNQTNSALNPCVPRPETQATKLSNPEEQPVCVDVVLQSLQEDNEVAVGELSRLKVGLDTCKQW
jgi:hypothetical protein